MKLFCKWAVPVSGFLFLSAMAEDRDGKCAQPEAEVGTGASISGNRGLLQTQTQSGLSTVAHSNLEAKDSQENATLPRATSCDEDYFKQLRTFIVKTCGSVCTLKTPAGRGEFFDQVTEVAKCDAGFSTEMSQLDGLSECWPPPSTVPEAFMKDYMMDNSTPVNLKFSQHNAESDPLVWTQGSIDALVTAFSSGVFTEGSYGGNTSLAFFNVLQRYQEGVRGKHCAVLGSQNPWLEALLLTVGAAKVTTIEYKTIQSGHPNISSIVPSEWRDLWQRGAGRPLFDCIASFSSLEHAGLGRYQDILNPWGDLIAMHKLRCSLAEGGYAFIGLPSGPADEVVFNLGRIYGPRRWPQMLAGFQQLALQEVKEAPHVGTHAIAVAKKL